MVGWHEEKGKEVEAEAWREGKGEEAGDASQTNLFLAIVIIQLLF